MADMYSKADRSSIMRCVRSQQTSPEKAVEQLLRQLRIRFSQNVGGVPGKPDFVISKSRKILFVHGCFWHRHGCPKGQSTPASNQDYWLEKFERNQRRDRQVRRLLRQEGWSVATIWECQTTVRKQPRLQRRLERFLKQ